MIFYNGKKIYMNGNYPAIHYKGENAHIHRLEWIKHHGSIKNGYIIHHKDGNVMNWDISNLEMLSRSEHIKVHMKELNSKKHKVRVLAYKSDNDKVYDFNSIKEASNSTGATTCGIHRVFKGTQKQANGWKFERIGD